MARRKAHEDVVPDGQKRLVKSWEIVERPISARSDVDITEEVKAVLTALDEGKAVRMHLEDNVNFENTHMKFRYALAKFGAQFRYRRVDNKTLIAWAEKVAKGAKKGMAIAAAIGSSGAV